VTIFDERVEIGSDDTRSIYALAGSEAQAAVIRAREAAPDAVLLSGTGMPTLALLDPQGMPPIISSNHCLAQAMMRNQGIHL
jgi:maleate isomerase